MAGVNILDSLFDIKIPATDKEYINIRDKYRFSGAKSFIEDLWRIYQPYADINFRTAIASQFHQHFWEMYLCCSLLKLGFNISPSSGKRGGPDICIKYNSNNIWVEAVTATGGAGIDAMSEIDINEPISAFYVPEDRIILRLTNAIETKFKKYLKYLSDGIIRISDPYIIAINGRGIPLAYLTDDDHEYILKTVFPIGEYCAIVDIETLEIKKAGFQYRQSIKKVCGAPVSTDIFLDNKYDGISALLFSWVNPVNKPLNLGDDFILIHNPLAKNPLSLGYIKIGTEFWIKDNELKRFAHSSGAS